MGAVQARCRQRAGDKGTLGLRGWDSFSEGPSVTVIDRCGFDGPRREEGIEGVQVG